MAVSVIWLLVFLALLGGGLALLFLGELVFSAGIFGLWLVVMVVRVWRLAAAGDDEDDTHLMKTASPWWFSALLGANLLLIFLGERAFSEIEAARLLFTGLGGVGALAVTGLRIFTFTVTRDDRRRVERALLFCHVGVLIALGLYALTTEGGLGLLGLEELEPEAITRYQVAMSVVWSIVMVVSLVPILMIEASLGLARRGRFSPALARSSTVAQEAVEAFRVREMVSSGLVMALAASFLMVTCNIAEQRNVRRDVSYFKTSSPGESTIRIARRARQPIRVLLFFPEVNQVKNEVLGYFRALQDAGGRVVIEEHDRMISVDLAREFRVRDDGYVVLSYDDKFESFKLTSDPAESRRLRARMELRELDGKVNAALLKVVRARRVAYMTVGHGELNDELGTWGYGRTGAQTKQIESILESLNYELEPLGLIDGLGREIPDDADLVLLLAPRQPLGEAELITLDKYLARGGKMLIVLDPESDARLGLLEQRLGVRFEPTPITDNQNFLANLRNPRAILTNRFSSHASITSLSRSGPRQGMLFLNAGSFSNVELDDPPRRTYVIRSMDSSYGDVNGDFRFNEETETRRKYGLVIAVEEKAQDGAKAKAKAADAEDGAGEDEDGAGEDEDGAGEDEDGAGEDEDGAGEDEDGAGEDEDGAGEDEEPMRVMLIADADIFIDMHQSSFPLLGVLFRDVVKWLGGEEEIVGEVSTEKDVRINHTRSEDVLWFYATIVGAPFLVLGIGFWSGSWRRQRRRRSKRRRK